ncbi:hypothetical protein ACMT4L_13905 [Deinococcus sp. A31D244]|uniref:hypothetical protein n=1 Tax=Deinococcus sp. A31D244 TaxID=3397675 RepID=UPI0039E0A29D
MTQASVSTREIRFHLTLEDGGDPQITRVTCTIMRTYALINNTVPLALLCFLAALALGFLGARRQRSGLRQASTALAVLGTVLLIVSLLLTLLIP